MHMVCQLYNLHAVDLLVSYNALNSSCKICHFMAKFNTLNGHAGKGFVTISAVYTKALIHYRRSIFSMYAHTTGTLLPSVDFTAT